MRSKKFIMAVLGVVVTLLSKLGLNLNVEELFAVVSPIVAYIVGQGIADTGKERAKIENEVKHQVAEKLLQRAKELKDEG